ncbi:MAG: dimethylsulfonioproprionate lyase family protein [Pseudomonadota bacterium]
MKDRNPFNDLFLSLSEAFSKEPRAGGKAAAEALRAADLGTYRRTVSEEDPLTVLKAVSELPDALPLVQDVLRCAPSLDWTCWAGAGLSDDISSRLFTTELLGPDGHIPADGLRVGLLASEPWTDYPLSNHSGEETYLVISGVAEWVLEDSGYVERRPGEFVHHPAWAMHGRRTTQQPFLGAWRWSGDLDLSSFSVA